MTMVIPQQMKTAISLPDELFQRVDALAKQLGIPRSQLYARALNEYLAAHGPEHVTAALDAVYSRTDSSLDRNIVAAQAATLSEDDWE